MRIQNHPTQPVLSMSLLASRRSGRLRWMTAVWDSRTGRLLWAPERASDIGWSPDGTEALVLTPRFGRGPGGRGIGHRLLRFSWPNKVQTEERLFSVPSGGADRLVISPGGNLAVVVAVEQGDWYYELLQLRPKLRQLHIGYHVREMLGDCPAFSPDEEFLVSIGSPGWLWWAADRDDPQSPSTGGLHQVAKVYVHDLKKKRVSQHALSVDLDEGWRPRSPEAGEWEVVWGPVFQSPRTFRLWLPDGQKLDLTLPLPKALTIPVRLNRAGRTR
jgi:hypothetical protein